jgi:hypothetical protein
MLLTTGIDRRSCTYPAIRRTRRGHSTVSRMAGLSIGYRQNPKPSRGWKGWARRVRHSVQLPNQVPWRRSSGPVKCIATVKTLICRLAPLHHGGDGAVGPLSARPSSESLSSTLSLCLRERKCARYDLNKSICATWLVRDMWGKILQQVAVNIKRPVEASRSTPPCLDAAAHFFRTDRSACIGIFKTSPDHSRKRQLS